MDKTSQSPPLKPEANRGQFAKGRAKTGGSVKGKSSRSAKLLAKIKEDGKKDPVEHMLNIMNDDTKTTALRLDAAKAVAPYVHRKMPVSIENTDMSPLKDLSEDELLQRLKEYQAVRIGD